MAVNTESPRVVFPDHFRVFHGDAAPTAAGDWQVGDLIINEAPAANGAWGWVITAVTASVPTCQTVRALRVSFAAAAPSEAGGWAVGDLILNSAPASGAVAGWMVTALDGSGIPTCEPLARLGSKVLVLTGDANTLAAARVGATLLVPAGTLTLPDPATQTSGERSTVYATAASVTLAPAAGQIDGAAAKTLAANAHATIMTDGTNWYTVG